MATEHTLSPVEQLRHPGGKNGLWQVRCSCEKYVTAPTGYPGHAESAAAEHKRAKEARR